MGYNEIRMSKKIFAFFLFILILSSPAFAQEKTSEESLDFIAGDSTLYLDRENYILIRVDPHTREHDIAEYKKNGTDAITDKFGTETPENLENCSPLWMVFPIVFVLTK
jgi:hypothetical protein